jgi:3-oxoacyl-[acyl-carrier protein] reductase
MPKVILVTGAARGIGRAIALRFAAAGYHVVINSVKDEVALNLVKQEVNAYGVSCISFLGDMGNYKAVSELFATIKDTFGTLDILINNAGVSHVGLFTDMKPDEYQSLISTNLISVMNCCHQAIPLFVHNHAGVILNISSVWGNVGASCEAVYSATKGGINSFTKALGKELAPSNISVNAIACGAVDTTMNSCFTKEELAALNAEIPAGRMTTPEEVAEFALSICTAPSYLNGQIITFDGAWT